MVRAQKPSGQRAAITPLQRHIRELIARYEVKHAMRLSGGELASRVGKSRNLMSQILNDGLIPSGEVVIRIGQALEADDDELRALLIDAMHSKAQSRARDTFWMQQALILTESLHQRVLAFTEYLKSKNQIEDFERWLGGRAKKPKSPRKKGEGTPED